MKLPFAPSYDALCRDFSWDIPARFNIGTLISDDWAEIEPQRICLQHFDPGGDHLALTYGELSARSNALAHALSGLGIAAGDRVALLLPQGFETVIWHAAIYKMGAIALPLALLFGAEALEYRLKMSDATAIVTNGFGLERLADIRDRLPELRHVIVADERMVGPGILSMEALIAENPAHFEAVATGPDDPALMIFTSGTTGPPKAALHGHRVLAGHLPGFQIGHDFAPQDDDRIWTPADWAWAGGLLNVVLPSLMLGIPVVSSPAQKFDPDMAVRIMAEMGVRNAFIPPTALRLMRSAKGIDTRLRALGLRTITSAGEALGRETYDWAAKAFGVTVNELYGQTECNFVLASSASLGISRSGATGLPVPGHRVGIVDDTGRELSAGQIGQIAIHRPDPVMFLGYFRDEAATEAKFAGDWLLTGDLGRCDGQGYFEFLGRDDDIITSSGYRIGPSEVEDCLNGHPAVRMAGVVGKPDPVRTEIVKAYVVLADGYAAGEALAMEIREWVKSRLSMHEYPREVAFVEEIPMTTSGKLIRRVLRDKAIAEAAVEG
ncbi:AMP-binding protein [Neorhizobium alkalisoli]|uniref:Acetyl-CoA synthetase n=1 Tax=Neorhizobium alkalisoli TaxID=528178 RepID=A0A561QJ37_9HYPH|nr:AMP-binding protein [Neorhizobium alkalisoli]TWF50371.1 acetyl-CoA synthetase [Neorhizobium alkalisoli]